MILTFRKKTGQVVMTTERGQFVSNEHLDSIILPDDPRMKQGYEMRIRDGSIEYEKTWWMLDREKEEAKKKEFTKNIDDINNAKSIAELKPLLIKLIQTNK